jgi:hypothetical protein
VLDVIGSSDVISFLGLGGLFTAHITGNLVILAAHVLGGEPAQVTLMLSVPSLCGGAYPDETAGRRLSEARRLLQLYVGAFTT